MNRQNGNKNGIEGIAFSIFGIVFMLYWMYTAAKGGAYFLALFFGGFGLFSMVRNLIIQCRVFKNRKNSGNSGSYGPGGYNTSAGESDPWDVSYPENRPTSGQYSAEQYGSYPVVSNGKNFCPYCGVQRQADFEFCGNCGKKIASKPEIKSFCS